MGYRRMTLRRALELAAPHTWPASILPVCLGSLLALADTGLWRPWPALLALAAAVLLQSAVNTFNDVRDFVRGTDTAENCTNESDAAMLFGSIQPRAGLALGFGFSFFAALCGLALGFLVGWRVWCFGLAAAAAIALYTAGGLSGLPLGELLSGLSMGGVLPLAAYYVQCGQCRWPGVWRFLPAVLTIACIMLTNNTADILRDEASGRMTLAVRLGQRRAARLLNALLLAALLTVCAAILFVFPGGLPALPVVVIGAVLSARPLYLTPVAQKTRDRAMGAAVRTHDWITGGYIAALAVSLL